LQLQAETLKNDMLSKFLCDLPQNMKIEAVSKIKKKQLKLFSVLPVFMLVVADVILSLKW
jgi:hypothetical protein